MRFRVEKEADYNKRETYRGVTCCDEWLDFQNFAEWYDQVSNGQFFKRGWHLDKDILCWGLSTKKYSPETCLFLPKDINNILVNRANDRGAYPIGVTKSGKGFNARIDMGNKRLNYYSDSIEDCFLFYKKHKEEYAKYFVNSFPEQLDPRVYEFFNNTWEVNIDD